MNATRLGFNWTIERARSMAAHYTAATEKAQIEAVASKMVELDTTVWHAASVAFSWDKCPCGVCAKAKDGAS